MGYRVATLGVFVVLVLLGGITHSRPASNIVLADTVSGPQKPSQAKRPKRRQQSTARQRSPRIEYSNFSHRTLKHIQSCDACHKFPSPNWNQVRSGDAAFEDVTDFPQHASCIGCHTQQFFTGARPLICSVCHTDATPHNGTRFPFPSLGEDFYSSKKGEGFASDFKVNFPHDKHIEIIGKNRPGRRDAIGFRVVNASFRQETATQPDKSCSTCHQIFQPQGTADDEYFTRPPKGFPEDGFWLKKGTFMTAPLTHASCFTCHSQESGIAPMQAECNACHKLPAATNAAQTRDDFVPALAAMMAVTDNLTLARWRRRESGTYRHEFVSHAELACTSCHSVTTMNTLDEKSKKVPILSCGGAGTGCHITPTADDGGILNYVVDQRRLNPAFQCTKCHVAFGTEPIPDSHLAAIAAIKTKAGGR